MNKTIGIIALSFTILAFTACNQEKKSNNETKPVKVENAIKGLIEDVLTKEQQAALTPDEVIKTLQEGNVRFTNNNLTARDHSEQVRKSTLAQFPKAIVLSCVDS